MGLPIREDLIKISDVPAVIFRLTGIKRTRQTIVNWYRKGVRAYDNRNVKLRVERRLRIVFTTEEYIKKFIKDISR